MTIKRKLHIKEIPSIEQEILDDTPNAGDQRIYRAYHDPGKQMGSTLTNLVIERIDVIYTAGVHTIQERYAVTAAASVDQLEFNKLWASRASYTYKPLYF
jgi:hypothetical protein